MPVPLSTLEPWKHRQASSKGLFPSRAVETRQLFHRQRFARQGGLVGLLLGLILAGTILGVFGVERGIKAAAFGIMAGLAITGLLLGILRNR